MTGLLLRDAGVIAVIRCLVQYRKTFEWSYEVSFDEMRIGDIYKLSVFCGSLQSAAEATYRLYFRVTRLMPGYLKAPQLIEKVEH